MPLTVAPAGGWFDDRGSAGTLSGTNGHSYAPGASLTDKTCYMAPGVRCQFTGSVSPSDLSASSPQWTISGTKTTRFAVADDQSTGSPEL